MEYHLQKIIVDNQVDCILDVGANEGQYARSIRDIGYRGLIVSFEPNPALHAGLTAASSSDPLWVIEPIALGDTDGTLTLHVAEGSQLTSPLTPSAFGQAAYGEILNVAHVETVPTRRLDTLLPELMEQNRIDNPYLKMDTQGYDLHVLRGAEGVWSRLVGLQTEVSFQPLYDGMPDVVESLTALRHAGFIPAGMYPVAHDVRNGTLIEMDCVAVRQR